jgi:hypothetical protein
VSLLDSYIRYLILTTKEINKQAGENLLTASFPNKGSENQGSINNSINSSFDFFTSFTKQPPN